MRDDRKSQIKQAECARSMFNVFLPTFLEEKLGDKAGSGNRLESLIEYCIYTIAGYVCVRDPPDEAEQPA